MGQIFEENQLDERGVTSFEKFYEKYVPINDRYWARYHNGIVSKEKLRHGRFDDTLKEFSINDTDLAERMAESYVSISPQMTALFPDAVEVLQYLQGKYQLHLNYQWVCQKYSR